MALAALTAVAAQDDCRRLAYVELPQYIVDDTSTKLISVQSWSNSLRNRIFQVASKKLRAANSKTRP